MSACQVSSQVLRNRLSPSNRKYAHAQFGAALLVLCIASSVSTLAQQGATGAEGGPLPTAPRNYTLVFLDSFPGDSLNSANWSYRTGVRLLSQQLPTNVIVGSNTMNINVEERADQSPGWSAGGVDSIGQFRYGYYQVQSQVTANPGWHTSFWASGNDGANTTEIDGFEIGTEAPAQDSMGLHSWVGGHDTNDVRCVPKAMAAGYNSASAMHVYGFEWTEVGVTYYIDGLEICTQPYSAAIYTHNLINIRLSSVGYSADSISVTENPSPNVFANLSYFVRDYYVNALESGYTVTGTWVNSSLPGFSNLTTQDSNVTGSAAEYTPAILTAANYDVQVWKTQSANADPEAELTVNYADGSIVRQIDFTAGASGWVDLGIYPFDVGSDGNVVIAYSGSGFARASMVKFVRQ